MGQVAAKRGDRITATDTHMVLPPSGPAGSVPMPFLGEIDDGLSDNVRIMGQPAAVAGSTARNFPPHVAAGGSFVNPPANRGTIQSGSATVRINGKPAARHGDQAMTCNDPADLPVGSVLALGSVRIG